MVLENFKSMWFETDREKREAVQDIMQNIVDCTAKAEFDAFDGDPLMKSDNPVLQYYDAALERLLTDIPATQVLPGQVAVWYLYNMGYVIKTPTGCFGVDIHHRHAEKLVPLLDFTAVTHYHRDHFDLPFLYKMNEAGKMVISSFFPNAGYTKAFEYTYDMPGKVTVCCSEADHNATLKKFVMPLEFVCVTGDKKFVFFTSGDCCDHEFLCPKSEQIDLYAIHPRCIMDPLKAVEKVSPQMTFICHLHELSHEINCWRWQYSVGRDEERALAGLGKKSYVPVWGEKFIWDGTQITVCR